MAQWNGLLDSYQLKSLDALLEHAVNHQNSAVVQHEGKLKLMTPQLAAVYNRVRAESSELRERTIEQDPSFATDHPNIAVTALRCVLCE